MKLLCRLFGGHRYVSYYIISPPWVWTCRRCGHTVSTDPYNQEKEK